MRNGTAARRMTAVWLLRLLGADAGLFVVTLALLSELPGAAIASAALAVLLTLAGGAYLPAYCRAWSWTLSDGRLRTVSGVLTKKTVSVRLSGVTTALRGATPLMRLFGLSSVALNCAGARVWVRFADTEDALALCAAVSRESGA